MGSFGTSPQFPNQPIQGSVAFGPQQVSPTYPLWVASVLLCEEARDPPAPQLPSRQTSRPERTRPLAGFACSSQGIEQKCKILAVFIHNAIETFLVFRGFLCQTGYLWKVRVIGYI